MIPIKVIRTIAAIVLFPAFTAIAAVPDIDIRKELLSGARQEILRLGRTEIPPGELGDWRETIDTTLFMLFRSTELYRGPIRVMVVNDKNIFSTLYPEGTMILSTGLLDHIDLQVFQLSVNDPRRARDHTGERERKLAPYLAYNAARLALDNDFSAFRRIVLQTGPSRHTGNLDRMLESTSAEIHDTDLVACVILELAGYTTSLFTQEYLSTLAEEQSIRGTSRSSWFASVPPEKRKRYIHEQTVLRDLLYSGYSGILQTLRTRTAFGDAVNAIESIRESRSGGIYLDRLEALINHQYWLSAIPAEQQHLMTLFPAAAEENNRLSPFAALAGNRKIPAPSASGIPVPGKDAGNPALYNRAIQAYRKFLSAWSEPALASAYALLLFQGGDSTDTPFLEAETAARLETLSSGYTARANHASLLFLSGKDPAGAERILSRLARQTGATSHVLLNEGIPSDDREILTNRAIMLRAAGDHSRADSLLEHISMLSKRQSGGTHSFRGISLGTTATGLADRLGKPDSITYNYYHEVWEYPKLGLVITLQQTEKDTDPKILRIQMNAGSPVSPGGDIRTGDSRGQFERVFGKPAYRAGDRDVYLSNDMRISVQYLFDRIRSITAGY